MPELIEPPVGLAERLSLDGVQTAGPLRPHRREARLSQHAEMLRDRGLGDSELMPDDVRDGAGAQLLIREQFEDAAPNRIAENVERVHQREVY